MLFVLKCRTESEVPLHRLKALASAVLNKLFLLYHLRDKQVKQRKLHMNDGVVCVFAGDWNPELDCSILD